MDAEGEALVEAWKQTLAAQMHLSTLSLQIRSAALTIIAAIIGASGFSAGNKSLTLAAALVIWPAFFLMDRYWYHPLFLGAVYHCMALERMAKDLGFLLPGKGGAESDNSLFGLIIRIAAESGKSMKLHTTQKLFLYYLLVNTGLWFLFLYQSQLFVQPRPEDIEQSLLKVFCMTIAINLELLYIYLFFNDPAYLPQGIQEFFGKLRRTKLYSSLSH